MAKISANYEVVFIMDGRLPEEQVAALVKAIRDLMKTLNVPASIKDCGIDEDVFMKTVPGLSMRAFEDQCTTANPRYPLVSELEEIYKKAYYGK